MAALLVLFSAMLDPLVSIVLAAAPLRDSASTAWRRREALYSGIRMKNHEQLPMGETAPDGFKRGWGRLPCLAKGQ